MGTSMWDARILAVLTTMLKAASPHQTSTQAPAHAHVAYGLSRLSGIMITPRGCALFIPQAGTLVGESVNTSAEVPSPTSCRSSPLPSLLPQPSYTHSAALGKR